MSASQHRNLSRTELAFPPIVRGSFAITLVTSTSLCLSASNFLTRSTPAIRSAMSLSWYLTVSSSRSVKQ